MGRYLSKLIELGFTAGWMTDEASGTDAFDSIAAYDGIYTGGSITLNQASLAANGEHASVDINAGTSGYLQIADDAAFQTNDATVVVLGLIETLVDNRSLGNFRSSSNNGGWTIDVMADGRVSGIMRVNTGTSGWKTAAASAGTIVASEAALWGITYDGDYVRLYKNGAQVAISAIASGVLDYGTGTRYMRFGQHITNGTRIDGRIQGPAIANYALSAAQVEDLYLSTTRYGSATGSIQPLTAALAGVMQPSGTATGAIQPLTSALAGTHGQTGTATGAIQPLTAAATGTQTQTGTIAAAIQPLTSALAGTHEQAGTATGAIQPLTAALVGVMQPEGTAASAVQPLTSALSGYMHPEGTLTATLAALTAALVGTFRIPPDRYPGRVRQPGVARVGRSQPGSAVRKWL